MGYSYSGGGDYSGGGIGGGADSGGGSGDYHYTAGGRDGSYSGGGSYGGTDSGGAGSGASTSGAGGSGAGDTGAGAGGGGEAGAGGAGAGDTGAGAGGGGDTGTDTQGGAGGGGGDTGAGGGGGDTSAGGAGGAGDVGGAGAVGGPGETSGDQVGASYQTRGSAATGADLSASDLAAQYGVTDLGQLQSGAGSESTAPVDTLAPGGGAGAAAPSAGGGYGDPLAASDPSSALTLARGDILGTQDTGVGTIAPTDTASAGSMLTPENAAAAAASYDPNAGQQFVELGQADVPLDQTELAYEGAPPAEAAATAQPGSPAKTTVYEGATGLQQLDPNYQPATPDPNAPQQWFPARTVGAELNAAPLPVPDPRTLQSAADYLAPTRYDMSLNLPANRVDALGRAVISEVGTGNPAATQANLEETYNRAQSYLMGNRAFPGGNDVTPGGALSYALSDPTQASTTRMAADSGAPLTAAQNAGLTGPMENVLAGSNLTNYATGNYMGVDPGGFNAGYQTYSAGVPGQRLAENFGVEGPDRPFAGIFGASAQNPAGVFDTGRSSGGQQVSSPSDSAGTGPIYGPFAGESGPGTVSSLGGLDYLSTATPGVQGTGLGDTTTAAGPNLDPIGPSEPGAFNLSNVTIPGSQAGGMPALPPDTSSPSPSPSRFNSPGLPALPQQQVDYAAGAQLAGEMADVGVPELPPYVTQEPFPGSTPAAPEAPAAPPPAAPEAPAAPPSVGPEAPTTPAAPAPQIAGGGQFSGASAPGVGSSPGSIGGATGGQALPPPPQLVNAMVANASPAVQQAASSLTPAQQTQVSQYAFGLINQYRQMLLSQGGIADPSSPQWQQGILPQIQQQTQQYVLQLTGRANPQAVQQIIASAA